MRNFNDNNATKRQQANAPDEFAPWRVVGVGKFWQVWDKDGLVHGLTTTTTTATAAHQLAKDFKLLHPKGSIETTRWGESAYSGPVDDFISRAAGVDLLVYPSVHLLPEQKAVMSLTGDKDSAGRLYVDKMTGSVTMRTTISANWLKNHTKVRVDSGIDETVYVGEGETLRAHYPDGNISSDGIPTGKVKGVIHG